MKNFLFALIITALGTMGCTNNETINLNDKEQVSTIETKYTGGYHDKY